MVAIRLKWNAIRVFIREIRKKRAEMMDDLVTLPVECVRCGRAVTLRYRSAQENEMATQSWACPYDDCRSLNTIGVSGVVLEVLAGYEPPQR